METKCPVKVATKDLHHGWGCEQPRATTGGCTNKPELFTTGTTGSRVAGELSTQSPQDGGHLGNGGLHLGRRGLPTEGKA